MSSTAGLSAVFNLRGITHREFRVLCQLVELSVGGEFYGGATLDTLSIKCEMAQPLVERTVAGLRRKAPYFRVDFAPDHKIVGTMDFDALRRGLGS